MPSPPHPRLRNRHSVPRAVNHGAHPSDYAARELWTKIPCRKSPSRLRKHGRLSHGDVSGSSVWGDCHSDWILSGNQRRKYLSCRAFDEQNFLIDWAGRQDVLSIGGRSLMTGNPSIIL